MILVSQWKHYLIVALLVGSACGGADGPLAPVAGTIGGQPFMGGSVAMVTEPNSDLGLFEIRIGEGDVCTDLRAGETPNTAHITIYVPKHSMLGTSPLIDPDVTDGDGPFVVALRLDGECKPTTVDIAAGTLTLTAFNQLQIAGSLSATTPTGDHVAGQFAPTCVVERGPGCHSGL